MSNIRNLLRILAVPALAFLLAASPALQAQPAKLPPAATIIVGLNDSPPLSYLDGKGNPQGTLVRLATDILARAGIPATVGVYPAPRLFKGLQEGGLQFSILVRAPVLDSCCLYSKDPVMKHVLRVYSIGDQPPIQRKEDLVGKSVIGLNGYSYGGMANFLRDEKSHIRLESAPGIQAAFEMLRGKRANYLLAYDANALEYLATSPMPGLISQVIAEIPIYIVLSKSYPDAAKTLARLEVLAKELEVSKK